MTAKAHLYNNEDKREHIEETDCWCKPYLYRTVANGVEVWVHHDEDGNTPPPDILAEAIILACFEENDDEKYVTGQPLP